MASNTTFFLVVSLIFSAALVQAYQPKLNYEYQDDFDDQTTQMSALVDFESQNPKSDQKTRNPTFGFRAKLPKYERIFDELKSKFPWPTPESSQEEQKPLNVIDVCWRRNPNWAQHRQELADCARGFGSGALGGKNGKIYVVTDDSDNVADPKPGTLRYGSIQDEPLWIIFERDMVIKLENDLFLKSYKTIDGRGAKVVLGNGGPCIKIKGQNHIIIHGITLDECKPGTEDDSDGVTDGDAIGILSSSKIWIDHCNLSRAIDGLIDVTHASTAVTISNNFFSQHDKVVLLGHSDTFSDDRAMEVTVAYNYFGPGCVQRMPRVRYGYAHVVNNRYEKWQTYAIGGSANPTILSEGNYFVAPDSADKQVTDRHTEAAGIAPWQTWKWRSTKSDVFLNGAYFVQSGSGSITPAYTANQALPVADGNAVPDLTAAAGPLPCVEGKIC